MDNTRGLTWDYVCELEAALRVALAALERNMGDEPSVEDVAAHAQISAALVQA